MYEVVGTSIIAQCIGSCILQPHTAHCLQSENKQIFIVVFVLWSYAPQPIQELFNELGGGGG